MPNNMAPSELQTYDFWRSLSYSLSLGFVVSYVGKPKDSDQLFSAPWWPNLFSETIYIRKLGMPNDMAHSELQNNDFWGVAISSQSLG